MKTLFGFLIAVSLCLSARAVTLQAAEWFIDGDPGEGAGTAFTGFSGGGASLNLTIPAGTINALSEGVHLLGVRFQDSDGAWGHVVWRSFLNQHPQGGLAQGEYFLDADPGEGAGTSISGLTGATASLEVMVPATTTNALSEGVHLLGVRFRDGDGEWGQVVWRVFGNQHPHGGLVVGEYFFNSDPGLGLATPMSGVSGGSHAAEHTVAVAALPAGANLLGVRFQDGDGEWGQTVYRVFLNPETGSRVLNRVEFVVYRSGSPVSSGSVLGDGSLMLDVAHAPSEVIPVLAETLLLEVQVVDDSGRRSHKVFREIPVAEFSESFSDLFFTGAEQADALVSGDDADPDGDGLKNLIEQVMGLHPREADSGEGTLAVNQLASGRQFSFRSAEQSVFDAASSTFQLGGVTVEVVVTSDFTDWSRATSPADFTVSSASAPNEDGSYRQVVDLAETGHSKRFFRLRVTKP